MRVASQTPPRSSDAASSQLHLYYKNLLILVGLIIINNYYCYHLLIINQRMVQSAKVQVHGLENFIKGVFTLFMMNCDGRIDINGYLANGAIGQISK